MKSFSEKAFRLHSIDLPGFGSLRGPLYWRIKSFSVIGSLTSLVQVRSPRGQLYDGCFQLTRRPAEVSFSEEILVLFATLGVSDIEGWRASGWRWFKLHLQHQKSVVLED
jgi:hypothetical protein